MPISGVESLSARSSSARVVHLDQHVHAVVERAGLERREPGVVERGDDQQDRVGAERARLRDLVFVDDEFLAQRRQRARRARLDEIFGRALEKRPVGQHRQARGARLLVRRGDRRAGRKASRSTPRLGLAFLISAITAGAPAAMRCAERPLEIRRGGAAARALGLDFRKRARELAPR